MITRIDKLITVSLIMILLTACGGGTGGVGTGDTIVTGDTATPQVLISGTFVDSAVGGIDYIGLPSGTTGITNANGTWEVEDGDAVTFRIGSIDIGSAVGIAGGVLTPADLAGDPTNAASPRAIRIARLLQSIDNDSDSSNGITITDATKTVINTATQATRDNITAALLSGSSFDTVVGGFIDELTANNLVPRVEGDLVSAVDAEAELLAAINAATGGGGTGSSSSITAAVTGNCPIGVLADAKKIVFGQNFPVCVLFDQLGVFSITNDVTLTNDHIYVLATSVNVGDGDLEGGPSGSKNAVLTIEPGTQIMGAGGAQIVLVVTRGSRINAVGTPDLPIIMGSVLIEQNGATSTLTISGNVEDLTSRGQWGGLVLSGFGENNKCTGDSATSTEVATEAAPDGVTRFFGCNNNADNSGSVQYVLIAESGLEFRPDQEVQGLTLEAVGSGTKLNFLQIIGSDDDGIEWFGGAVSISNLVINGQEDDGIDFDEGIQATVQKVLIITGATKGDEGIEADNAGPGDDANPKSQVNFVNVTLLGNVGSQDPSGANFKDGFGGNMIRSAIVDISDSAGWDDCMDLDDQVDTFTAFRDVVVKCANGDQGSRGWGIRNDGDGFENAIADGGNDESGSAISSDRRDFTVFAGPINSSTLAIDPGVAPDNPAALPAAVNDTAIGNYFGAIDPSSGNPDNDPNNNGGGGGPFWDGWTYRNTNVEGNLPGANFHPLQAEIQAQ
ncbi:MAG: hypothetical protein ACI9XC_002396 [Gammaproteobacteria bacterium]|jgi:hypothetical protein